MTYLSEVCAFLGDAARAATLYQLLLPYAGYNIVLGVEIVCYGAATRYLALLASTMSRWEVAERHFNEALAMKTRMGARPYLARTQYEYAEMLRARGQPEDRAKALARLDEALGIACEVGTQSRDHPSHALMKGGCQSPCS
jgi:tetratricopeptide (TPR) repeat protein